MNKYSKIAIECFFIIVVSYGVGRFIGLDFWEKIFLFLVLYGLYELVLLYAKKK